ADTEGQVTSLGTGRSAKFQQMLEDLYTGAASCDVYTEEIGEEMEQETGKKHDLIIHCGAEPEEMEKIRNDIPQKNDDKIRIGYPGTIISEDTFARFMAALKMLPSTLTGRIEVHLFGIHSYRNRAWYDPTLILEHGYLTDDELDRRYRECDWGLAIMALDNSNPRYNKFSFPCKFARSLSSGLPVLCLAHTGTTLAGFASKYPISPVISTPDPGGMAQQLCKVFSEKLDPHKVRQEILNCVESEFNSEKNRKALFSIFRRISRTESLKQSRP
ncbi:MAG: glycosyltransferase, partial [bacterium]